MKYLHIMAPSKRMLLGYITMLREHFPADEHTILYRGEVTVGERILTSFDNVVEFASFGKGKRRKYIGLKKIMKEADHIIFHGFNMNWKWILFLYHNKKFLKKSSWLIWGIDMYNYIRPKKTFINFMLNRIETKCRRIVPVPIALNEADIPVYHKVISQKEVSCATYPVSEENWEIMDKYLIECGILNKNGDVIPAELRNIEPDSDKNHSAEDLSVEGNDLIEKAETASEDCDDVKVTGEESDSYSSIENFLRSLFVSEKENDTDNDFKITLEFSQENGVTHFVYHREVKNGSKDNSDAIKIIVGNNAHSFNRHQQILFQLKKFKNENIIIYMPLSYGNDYHSQKDGYVQGVEQYIASEFPKERYQVLKKLIPQSEYTKLLTEFDIGIFPAERQNALGNINKMLYLGKKVYLSKNNPMYGFYIEKGFEVHDVDELRTTSYEDLIKPISVDFPNPWLKDCYSAEGSARLWQQVFDRIEAISRN